MICETFAGRFLGWPMNAMSEQEYQHYLRHSKWSMRTKIDENEKEFGLGTFPRFDWDQWRGELVFSRGGVPQVVARIQVVGTWTSKPNLWLWSWANPGLLESLRKFAVRAKEFGALHGVLRLIKGRWAAQEADAWEMTALTFQVNEAKGAFRCPGPNGVTFMAFTDIRTVSDRKRIFGARTCSHVLEEDRAILVVSRESDGEVLAVCGGENDTAETTRDIPLDKLLALEPALTELADLPDGWVALRESPADEWVRSQAP
jgi:hypothetical protein